MSRTLEETAYVIQELEKIVADPAETRQRKTKALTALKHLRASLEPSVESLSDIVLPPAKATTRRGARMSEAMDLDYEGRGRGKQL